MRSTMKRIFTILLTATMLVGVIAVPAAAAAKDPPQATAKNPNNCTPKKPCKYSPTIIVPGIGQSQTDLYMDGKKTDLGGSTVFPDLAALGAGDYIKVVLALLASFVTQHDIGLTKALYNTVCKLFEPQRVGSDGKFVHDLRVDPLGRVSEMTDAEKHTALDIYVPAYGVTELAGEDHLFFFAFNLVDEVWNSVDELDEYIDYVRKVTGHDKVNLVNVSLGGTIFTGYLEKYGHKKLDQVFNVVATTNGTPMVADLITLNTTSDADFWYRDFLPDMMAKDISIADGYDRTIGYAIGGIVFRLLPHKLMSNVVRSAWQGVLDTIILNCTQFWAMIPSERYDAAVKMYLTGDAHKVVRTKTDSYHKAQLHLEKNVKAAVADGVYINNIAGSGLNFGDVEYMFFKPVNSENNSDGIIAVEGATMGATAARAGQKLPADYKPKKAGYMSPDGSIDCSTATLPDNTWVFLKQHHEVGRNDAVLNLVTQLYKKPGMNIHTDPKNYPQYNPSMFTNDLRRGRIDDAKTLLADADAGKIKVSKEDRAIIEAAIKEGEAVRKLTVGDPERAKAVTDTLVNMLIKYGRRGAPYEQTGFQKALEKAAASISNSNLYVFGDHGFIQGPDFKRIGQSIKDARS